MIKYWLAYIFLFFIPYLSLGQVEDSIPVGILEVEQAYLLKMYSLDKDKRFFKKQRIQFEYELEDTAQIQNKLQDILKQLHAKAYLTASIDTFFRDDSTQFSAYLFVGERYEWANLKNGNVTDAFLAAVGFKERLYTDQPFYYKEVASLQEKLLIYLENHGYPFAQVYIDSVRIVEQEVSARIYFEKGPLIFFDALKIVGKSRLPKQKRKKKVRITEGFVSSYLGIRKGKLYSEKLVQKVQNRMNALRYLTSYQTPYVIFRDNKAELNLFLMDRPSSKIDVLLGFLPSKDAVTGQQRFDFTGNIDIDLINPFGTGKRLQLKWQQLSLGTSDLLVRFAWPYLLKTPLGVDLSFKLYKRDSSYIDIITDVGLQYLFNGNSYIKAFWINTTTNLINIDTNLIRATRRLPSMLDIDNSSFGLEFYYDNLDYKYNPRKGFESKLVASFALKRIRRNNTIEEIENPLDTTFSYASLYDTIVTNTFQYRFLAEHSQFFQLWKTSTLMARYRGGIILSKDPIYDNETYRIGGNKLLRGFDEEAILATWYNVLTLEWRFLFGRNSYAYLFGDVAYVQRNTISTQLNDFPVGFGVGVALETKVGIFALSYALGTQQGNPIIFNNSKVHFGYVYSF
ncbi:BamA/TamA family outer membrane protein [Aureispira sp. CCB-E]|uniref:BamA/TamA family outer membrane protein n=1 Tax=Aureispira sp. CCB-E TaxID=3051121 RepID=UPI000698D9E4|nr:BamA/TamA family outer membrane protein [Aureispira sp. CCB-E]WMX13847.1 BamA/TamA family outer membrane protein [Aureispira sp. CCB-E]